jgi:hypothetical protein
MSTIAGVPPLYGMCCTSIPAAMLRGRDPLLKELVAEPPNPLLRGLAWMLAGEMRQGEDVHVTSMPTDHGWYSYGGSVDSRASSTGPPAVK